MSTPPPVSSTHLTESVSDGPADCWFCNPEIREVEPPGGWLHSDECWRVGHSRPGWGPAGTTLLESRRHFLDVSEMNAAEAASFGPLLGRVVAAVKQTVGAERVYLWSTMDRYPHLHVLLIPWWSDAATHGPQYLAESMATEGADEQQAERVAGQLRTLLSTA